MKQVFEIMSLGLWSFIKILLVISLIGTSIFLIKDYLFLLKILLGIASFLFVLIIIFILGIEAQTNKRMEQMNKEYINKYFKDCDIKNDRD